MQLIELTATNGKKISVVISKITGICEANDGISSTYVATGAEGEDDYNGWFVKENYEEVKLTLEQIG